jgi:hypothetical protein
MQGDVQNFFYRTLLQEASQTVRNSEAKFYDDFFNQQNRPNKTPESPLSEEARKTTELYLTRFQDSGLITPPMKIRECSERYPILKGYNYFNDPEFYKKTKDKAGIRLECLLI